MTIFKDDFFFFFIFRVELNLKETGSRLRACARDDTNSLFMNQSQMGAEVAPFANVSRSVRGFLVLVDIYKSSMFGESF